MYGVDYREDQLGVARDGELLFTLQLDSAAGGPRTVAAALVERLPADARRALWVTVAPDQGAAAMGALLRELRGAGLLPQGFADRAAVLAGWQQIPGQSILIDAGRAALTVSLVAGDGTAAELRRTVHIAGGSARLFDEWLNLAARTMVQQTRFDPLHDQQHEAGLREAVAALVPRALEDGQGQAMVTAGGRELSLTLSRDQLAAASAPVLQPLTAALQALAAGSSAVTLLVAESLLRVPGMAAVLQAAHIDVILRVPAGVAACGASLMADAQPLASGAVQYLTRVPALPAPEPHMPLARLHVAGVETAQMATHLVWRGRAIAIPSTGLVIGRDPAGAAAGLQLPEGVAGLSRRHCTLRREGGRTLLIDHSTHGSFLDGMRVHGRAFLAAGSTLRLGTPGLELPLVALHGAGSGGT